MNAQIYCVLLVLECQKPKKDFKGSEREALWFKPGTSTDGIGSPENPIYYVYVEMIALEVPSNLIVF